jgi:hypothetical protein
MEATIEARDADPVASKAAPAPVRHRPLVMVAKIPGGDDGYRQNLRIGDVRTPPVPPLKCRVFVLPHSDAAAIRMAVHGPCHDVLARVLGSTA